MLVETIGYSPVGAKQILIKVKHELTPQEYSHFLEESSRDFGSLKRHLAMILDDFEDDDDADEDEEFVPTESETEDESESDMEIDDQAECEI